MHTIAGFPAPVVLRKFALGFACLVSATALAGCDRGGDGALEVAVIAEPDDLLDRGARLGQAAQMIQAATAPGLVALDEQGQVVPAIAERWIVTDDGASYIFRLRDGTWPDGKPLSGEAVGAALRQALGSLRGTALGLDLGEIRDVRVMNGRVIELRLARPVPELLQLLAQPELGLRHGTTGAGPLRLARAEPGAGVIQLEPVAPASLGLPGDGAGPGYRAVRISAMAAPEATAAFARNAAAIVTGGRFADLPLARAASGLSRRSLQLDPAPGLFGLAVVSDNGPLANPAFREALAMAIDREQVGQAIGLIGWTVATRIVPSEAGAGDAEPRWAGWTLADRRAEAQARVNRWRAQGGGKLLGIRLALPEGPGADALFAQLSADLSAVGVPLLRVSERSDADLRLLDLVARYPGPQWYLNQLACATRRSLCSPAADAQLAAARNAGDPRARTALVGSAATTLAAAQVYLPMGMPIRWSLVRPDQPGFAPNPAAFHPLPPMALRSD